MTSGSAGWPIRRSATRHIDWMIECLRKSAKIVLFPDEQEYQAAVKRRG